jgi:hypothetical protein
MSLPKISPEDAFDIFVSDLPPKVLAHRYGICQGHISKIRKRAVRAGSRHLEVTAYCVPELLNASLVSMACGVEL